MSYLASNNKYLLLSKQSQNCTYLVDIHSLQQVGSISNRFKVGSLQHQTGIAAMAIQSKTKIYDFVYKKQLYDLETYQKVLRLLVIKNLLIIISEQRILIHDIKQKTNQCYIPIQQGRLSFVNPDYYTLKICYLNESFILCNRQVWLNKIQNIQGVKFEYGCYIGNGEIICLTLQNIVSFYSNDGELIKIYGLPYKAQQIVPLGDYFFVLMEDDQIIGCSLTSQIMLTESEDVEVGFWNSEESWIFATKDSVYKLKNNHMMKFEISKGVKCENMDKQINKKSSYNSAENISPSKQILVEQQQQKS